MAKFVKTGTGEFHYVLNELHNEIMKNSLSITLEESSDYKTKDTKVAVRVYERFSYTGGNRLSLSLFLVESDNKLYLNLISTGGSRALFFKVNRFGEQAFLNTVKNLADSLIK